MSVVTTWLVARTPASIHYSLARGGTHAIVLSIEYSSYSRAARECWLICQCGLRDAAPSKWSVQAASLSTSSFSSAPAEIISTATELWQNSNGHRRIRNENRVEICRLIYCQQFLFRLYNRWLLYYCAAGEVMHIWYVDVLSEIYGEVDTRAEIYCWWVVQEVFN